MKRYKFKPRFYVITLSAVLTLTAGAIAHIDNVCSANAPERSKPAAVEPATFEEENNEESDPVSLGEYTVTYYCSCEKCCGEWAKNRPTDSNGEPVVITASGAIAVAGETIAVDPEVIPYGTKVSIDGHTYTAQDAGGAIKGKRIDIYCDSHEEALNNSIHDAVVYLEG